MGNIVRRILHIIREEEAALASSKIVAVDAGSETDDDDDNSDRDDLPGLSAAAVAAASRSALRAPSLHNLLESVPSQSAVIAPSSSGGDSEGRSKCKHQQGIFMLALMVLDRTYCDFFVFIVGDKNSKGWKLKHAVMEAINELLQDIDSYHSQIAEQALEHIHQKYVWLQVSNSKEGHVRSCINLCSFFVQ